MGMIIAPVVTALNATTYTKITMTPDLSNQDITVYTDDLTSFLIATSDAGANAATVPANLSITFPNMDTHGTILYAKASAGTPNLVLLAAKVR